MPKLFLHRVLPLLLLLPACARNPAAQPPQALTCAHGNISGAVAMYLGKDRPVKTGEVRVNGKEVPVMKAPKTSGTLSDTPFLRAEDIDSISYVEDNHAQQCEMNGTCRVLPQLLFTLTPAGQLKMRAVTRAHEGAIIIIKNGDQVISRPVIHGEMENAALTPGANIDPKTLLQQMCTKPVF